MATRSTLDDLVKPPTGSSQGFISPDLSTNGVTKSGYKVTVAKDGASGVTDIGTTTACNGTVAQPASSFWANADPATPGGTGTRYFATDTRGTILAGHRDGAGQPDSVWQDAGSVGQ